MKNLQETFTYDMNRLTGITWSGNFSGTPMFDRGFTGHEHLYNFSLINMNGRMYDPVTSSFLSVDRYVQSPGNSQNFNRYAYCLNNPLRYVDPDGEEFLTSAIIIGSLLVGAYSGGVLTNGGEYNPTGVLNINALLPVTAPVLLNTELAIRSFGIGISPYLIQ